MFLSEKIRPVKQVETIRSKGNSALATLENASNCHPCVDAYATSEEMCASLVRKRKQQYEKEMSLRNEPPSIPSCVNEQEGMEERQHRQAAEHERSGETNGNGR